MNSGVSVCGFLSFGVFQGWAEQGVPASTGATTVGLVWHQQTRIQPWALASPSCREEGGFKGGETRRKKDGDEQ